MPFQISRKWSIGDVTIGVLGLNLWITFLVLPTLHFLQHSPGVATVAGIIAGPLLLAAGLHLHHRHLLLFGLPLSLFVPALFNPKLVGVNVYSAWSFALVATSFLAYMLATLAILRGHELPPVPEERRSIGEYVLSPRWRRRFRIYRWMAALSVLFPAVLIFGIFLDPEIQTLVRQSFPGRAQEAVTFFGIGRSPSGCSSSTPTSSRPSGPMSGVIHIFTANCVGSAAQRSGRAPASASTSRWS